MKGKGFDGIVEGHGRKCLKGKGFAPSIEAEEAGKARQRKGFVSGAGTGKAARGKGFALSIEANEAEKAGCCRGFALSIEANEAEKAGCCRGFALSIEAILSIALLGVLVSTQVHEWDNGIASLHVFKKENDLLVIWALGFEGIDEGRLRHDFETAFPGKSGAIIVDGVEITVGRGGGEAFSSEAVFLDGGLERHYLRVVVFEQDFS